ncbi:MAG: acetyltransferase, partial [Candidatus Omnitrophota bacterium]
MKKKIVIWGASGHALVVSDIIRLRGEYEIAGFLDNLNPGRHKSEFCGSTILGGPEELDDFKKKGISYIIFGFGDNNARIRLSRVAKEKGMKLAAAIHPKAVIAGDVLIGCGSVVCAGTVVNPGSSIGENTIINTSASIDHECSIGEGAHIGPGVCLGGKVKIGKAAWICIGSTVKDGISVGAGSMIGAGSLVLDDIPSGVIAYGAPAKVVKEVEADAD